MERKLDALNLESILGAGLPDTSMERYRLEVTIRKLDGVKKTCYWLLKIEGEEMLQFRRSLKLWLLSHKKYSFAVKIIYSEVEHQFFLECPIQISVSLEEWLSNYWGGFISEKIMSLPSTTLCRLARTSI